MHNNINQILQSKLSKIIKLITLVIVISWPMYAFSIEPIFKIENTDKIKKSLDLTRVEKAWLAEHKVITVGVKNSWKPIEFVSDQKKFRGITIDYLRTLEPVLGVKFDMFDIDEISTKDADILSSVSNPKNIDSSNYLLTNPILKFPYAIYVRKDNKNIEQIEDLNGKKVAVFGRGQLVNLLAKDFPKINLRKIDIIEEAFNDMDIKNSDAYIGNEMVVDYEANLQGISFLKKVGYAPIETELTMAVRNDWPILQSILNKSFIALEPEKNIILNNWEMSLFKKTNIFALITASIFVLLVGITLLRAYKLKQKIKTDALEAQQLIWHQAHYDIQTKLPNRMMFNKQLHEESELAKKNNLLIGLLYVDLDSFKEVNDHHGHSVGDLLLIQVARRLENCIRASDKVYRLGGDEFTIVLANLEDLSVIERTANRILEKLSEPFHINQFTVNITSSIGSTIYPNDTSNIEALIKNADMAMYEAKKLGKNHFLQFDQSMQDVATHQLTISKDLKKAITAKEFRLFYQPIVDLKTNKTVKAEALIRWQHPDKGLIGPFEFIEIAEETNAISQIGDWVFKQALEDVLTLKEAVHPDFAISLNVSPKQLGANSLLTQWPELLKKHNIPLKSIGIEITEGALLNHNKTTARIFNELRQAGAQFLIDDFGTGYSSLSYLKKLDVDFIKIDKSFVQNLSLYSEDMVLCEAIIVMAHKLGLKVVAEGIETVEQRDLLLAVCCDYGQGYLFAKPKPIDQIIFEYQSASEQHKNTSNLERSIVNA